jgi:hypothetical protein
MPTVRYEKYGEEVIMQNGKGDDVFHVSHIDGERQVNIISLQAMKEYVAEDEKEGELE